MITNLVLWKIPVEEKAALSVEPSLAELIRLLSNRSDQHFHIIKNELLGWGRINCYTTLIYMYKYLSISVTTWLIVINECVYSRRKMPLTSCLCLEFHIGEHRNALRGGLSHAERLSNCVAGSALKNFQRYTPNLLPPSPKSRFATGSLWPT